MTRLRRIFLIFYVIFFSATTHSIVAMEIFKAPFSKENPYNLVENVQKIVIINKENRALTDEQIKKITKTIITAVDKNSNVRRFVYYPETFLALLDLFEDYCIDQSSLRRLSNYLRKTMTAAYGNLIYTPITRDHIFDFCDDLLTLANKFGSYREFPSTSRKDRQKEQ